MTIQRIDTHAHFLPPSYRQACIEAGYGKPDGMPALPVNTSHSAIQLDEMLIRGKNWSKDGHLEFMEKAGIAKSILSISSPGTHLIPDDDDLARRVTRECNEFSAELKRQHPDKFGFWASLPLPDVKGSLEELAYAFDVLNADGVAVKTNMHGVYMGDRVLDPVFEELNHRRATVFIHPTSPCIGDGHTAHAASPLSHYPNPMFEFFFDTARAVINMFMTGFVDRFPKITVIICHAGGALPPLIERMANVATAVLGHPIEFNTEAVKHIFERQFYFDLAGYVFPDQIHGILRYVNASRLLYGTDYPFTPGSGALGMSRIMDTELSRVFPDEDDCNAILAENAGRLLEKTNRI
ncbi:hypothetical protein J7T55_011277 [Diaporthe amygdali]|uniref:uncharacterized protein n=1 Tax=Phomopsis amygdali TaxID=1214568 RepID=UPI0022FEF4F1|nr:uncharacterized protein J7T55_011277 [Diaporthe amygdali]KAJ0108786.1 hypothetical protein J7T55_011277 [Diaporthe amygdali]